MFNFEPKTVILSVAAVAAVVTVAVGVTLWYNRDQWQPEEADKALNAMLDAYNQAIADYPADRNKQDFAFSFAAAEIKALFADNFARYDEYAEWEKRFDAEVKSHKEALRKI